MPNWCNNSLELAHEDPAMLERARLAFNEGKLCNEFVPVPESLHIVAGMVSDEAEQKKLEEDTARNLAVHGYGNWYDYCVNEWGTKWDVGGDGMTAELENGRLMMSFDSAWAPPVAFYEKLLDMGFSVRAMYYEPGMGFAGIWEDGIDDFYEYGGMTSEEIAEELPKALDEGFCISEDVAMWEEENKEEEDSNETK